MKIRNTIAKLITITLAVAAMAVIGSIWAAGRAGAAGRQDINDIYVFRRIVGVPATDQQMIRVTIGNPNRPSGSPVVWSYLVTNPGGVPLYESERIQVPPREFRFSDVSPEDLNTEGEPETGRVQMMVTVTVEVPAGSNPEGIPASLELVNNHTGCTQVGDYIFLTGNTVE